MTNIVFGLAALAVFCGAVLIGARARREGEPWAGELIILLGAAAVLVLAIIAARA